MPIGGAADGREAATANPRLPRWFMVFLLLVGTGMILISLIGDQGLIAYYNLRAEKETLLQDLSAMRADKASLAREISALREDQEAIRHLARKNLGLVNRGDLVLQLPRQRGGGN